MFKALILFFVLVVGATQAKAFSGIKCKGEEPGLSDQVIRGLTLLKDGTDKKNTPVYTMTYTQAAIPAVRGMPGLAAINEVIGEKMACDFSSTNPLIFQCSQADFDEEGHVVKMYLTKDEVYTKFNPFYLQKDSPETVSRIRFIIDSRETRKPQRPKRIEEFDSSLCTLLQ